MLLDYIFLVKENNVYDFKEDLVYRIFFENEESVCFHTLAADLVRRSK